MGSDIWIYLGYVAQEENNNIETWSQMFRITTSIVHSFQIRAEIEKHSIRIYEFPDCDSDEDEEFKGQDAELKASAIRHSKGTTKEPFLGL